MTNATLTPQKATTGDDQPTLFNIKAEDGRTFEDLTFAQVRETVVREQLRLVDPASREGQER
jgi:hypothetical protein